MKLHHGYVITALRDKITINLFAQCVFCPFSYLQLIDLFKSTHLYLSFHSRMLESVAFLTWYACLCCGNHRNLWTHLRDFGQV